MKKFLIKDNGTIISLVLSLLCLNAANNAYQSGDNFILALNSFGLGINLAAGFYMWLLNRAEKRNEDLFNRSKHLAETTENIFCDMFETINKQQIHIRDLHIILERMEKNENDKSKVG